MSRQCVFLSAVLLSVSFTAIAPAVAQDSAITSDPAFDKANPAVMQSFQIPSRGARLNAFAYIAAGAGLHPTVILLHGFPSNERNLDLAQSIRRAGWNVLYFDYRGSWGSTGEFSFTHCIEDTNSAIAYLRDPTHAAELHADAHTIVLAGHSMGGFMARAIQPSKRLLSFPQRILALAVFNLSPSTNMTPPSATLLLYWLQKAWRHLREQLPCAWPTKLFLMRANGIS
jgi:pimeloyl-ACP methyl ester carboxylesterase